MLRPVVADGRPVRPQPRHGRGLPLRDGPEHRGGPAQAPVLTAADAGRGRTGSVAARQYRPDRRCPDSARCAGFAERGTPGGADARARRRADPVADRRATVAATGHSQDPDVPRAAGIADRPSRARLRWLTLMPSRRLSTRTRPDGHSGYLIPKTASVS